MLSKYVKQIGYVLVLIFGLGAAGCVGQVVPSRRSNEDATQRVAQDLVASTPAPGVDDGTIRLPRSLVGVPLLETRELITTGAAPELLFVKPRLLYFKLYPGYIALFESNAVSPHQDLRADHLIDTFALLDARDGTVSFQAPQQPRGMVITLPDDVPQEAMSAPRSQQLDVQNAVLEDADLTGETLRMRHVVHAWPAVQMERVIPASSTYYVTTTLAPYQPSSTFAPLEISGDRYFSVARVTPSTGVWVYRAMHWDMHASHAPIAFGLSRQMSPTVAQAVAEGIEYWNRVAGRTIVQVELDVDLATWGGPRKVPVHWLNWDSATASYTCVQPDPVTGEIFGASLVLTSRFAQVSEVAAAQEWLWATKSCSAATAPSLTAFDMPRFMQRIQVDNLRVLAAHETGHALGLRHNFAGALDAELRTPTEIDKAAVRYVAGEPPDRYASTTVMAYAGPRTTPLLGAYIKAHVLPYDVSAFTLQDTHTDGTTLPVEAFCGDEDARRVYGCATHLDGADPLQATAHMVRTIRSGLASELLTDLAEAVRKNHNRLDGNVYNHLSLEDIVFQVIPPASDVYTALRSSDAVLVRQRLGALRHLDPDTYKQVVRDHMLDRANDLGGLAGWLALAWDAPVGEAPKPGWLADDIACLMQHGAVPKLATAPDKTRAWVEQMALALSGRVEQLFLKALLFGITARPPENPEQAPLARAVFDPNWEAPLASLATELILATRDDGLPSYAREVRMLAVMLLDPRTFDLRQYAEVSRCQLLVTLERRIAADSADSHDKICKLRAEGDREIANLLSW